MNEIGVLFNEERNNGDRFQKKLAEFIVASRFETLVETGCGVSSVFILRALHHSFNMEKAMLYSIDPKPWYGKEIMSPQYRAIRKRSVEALPELYKETGPWDLFLHDSNHDILCMTYELNFAFGCLREGGVVACDDSTWGGHGAWERFVSEQSLVSHQMGSLVYAYKDQGKPLERHRANVLSDRCLFIAEERERDWLSSGNKNSDCFK